MKTGAAILLAVETVDDAARVALTRALALSLLGEGGLYVLRVRPPGTETVELFVAEQELRRVCRRHLDDALGADRLFVRAGDFTNEVKAVTARCEVALVVMPSGGPAAARAARIARQTRLPVLVARPHRGDGAIVAATDLVRPSYPVVRQVDELVSRLKARALLMHSVPPPAAADDDLTVSQQSELLQSVARSFAPSVEPLIMRNSDPLEAILAAQRKYECDLTIVGATVGRRPDLSSASLAEDVVRLADGSVLVTPVE